MTTNTAALIHSAGHGAPNRAENTSGLGNIAQRTTLCSTCNLRELCAPCCGLSCAEKDVAGRLVFTRLRLQRGENLYRSGDPFTSLYAVRSGFFKSTALRTDACDQVLRFSMTGDVLGMDGIGPEMHICNAVALEDSDVCAVPFAGLQWLAREIPGLQRKLHKTMSREIVRQHGELLRQGSMNAMERLAMFLLDMSRSFASRGYSPSEFNLRMSREDIGSYLGQELETVSRIFSKLRQRGLVRVEQKFVRILDRAGLERVLERDLE